VIHVISEADSDYLYAEGVKMEAYCYNGFLDFFLKKFLVGLFVGYRWRSGTTCKAIRKEGSYYKGKIYPTFC
jgi:hypothetical protein